MKNEHAKFEIDPTGMEHLEFCHDGGIGSDKTYVDLDTGAVITIGEINSHMGGEDPLRLFDDPTSPEAADALEALLAADPDRYVEVPEFCIDPLPDFIASDDWTDDADLLEETREVYWRNQRRYAGFKNNAPDAAVGAFHYYQEQRRGEGLKEFLVELEDMVAKRLETEPEREAACDVSAESGLK